MRIPYSFAVITATLTTLIRPAESYGTLGHTLTGQVAQLLLTPETARQVKEILSPYYDGLLSKAASWPDTIKMKPQYKWASVNHYVNTPNDNPPDECLFSYVYGAHDVVNGIYNMTSQLLHYKEHPPTTERDRSLREDALRFFVHFVGDIHQPLHTSGKDRGGNDALARWRRARTNLHKIWDSQMILKNIKDNFEDDPTAYLDDIMEKTSTIWFSNVANWTVCDPNNDEEQKGGKDSKNHPWSDTISTELSAHLCPKIWTREMSSLVCSYAWKDYVDTEADLSQEYYERATGADHNYLVQRLIAQSGVRMAAILNTIYDPNYSINSLHEWKQKPKAFGEIVATSREHRYRIRNTEKPRGVQL
ncbi:hypothetical protein BGW42_007438 [Actinomortierella wolfii]|nr:hypothetical protein BGW42_007438 [Actinomortierella wolfii]